MDFFINEILENDEIKEILLSDNETAKIGKKIADDIIKTNEIPNLESGILPIFVLAYLSDYALSKNNSRGIPKEITVASLKDINIWLENYKSQYNKLGLGEFCWLKNHYTGDLFKLNRLQFRLEKSLPGVPDGEFAIETHIPQGEPLNIEACLDSFAFAKDFFKKYFPEYSPKYFMCDSWLLNPNLEKILSADSNIVKFMKLFTPFPFESDDSSQAIERVFGFSFKKENIEHAPENTSLQKKLKAFLLSGGNLDITAGYRKI